MHPIDSAVLVAAVVCWGCAVVAGWVGREGLRLDWVAIGGGAAIVAAQRQRHRLSLNTPQNLLQHLCLKLCPNPVDHQVLPPLGLLLVVVLLACVAWSGRHNGRLQPRYPPVLGKKAGVGGGVTRFVHGSPRDCKAPCIQTNNVSFICDLKGSQGSMAAYIHIAMALPYFCDCFAGSCAHVSRQPHCSVSPPTATSCANDWPLTMRHSENLIAK